MSMKNISAVGAFLAIFSALTGVCADVWYVDAANYGKPDLDGSPEKAYGTIQQAIDATTTKAGHTILVRPGIYSNGVCEASAYGNRLRYPSRVFVNKDGLTIRSIGGRDKTIIVGRRHSMSATGCGAQSVACVFLDITEGLVLDGFTLRDGTVEMKSDSSTYNGGAVYHYYGTAEKASKVHLYDCAIIDCVCRDELVGFCQLHRCYVAGNVSTKNFCAGVADGGAENSLFVANSGTVSKRSPLVNCTVVGTTATKATQKAGAVCGTIITMNQQDYDDTKAELYFTNSVSGAASSQFEHYENCAFGVAGKDLFVAPIVNDYRLLSGSEAVGRATSADLTIVPLPDGYVYRDYPGNTIDMTKATINAGAFQDVVSVEGGCCVFENVTSIRIDGCRSRNASINFGYAEAIPKDWVVTSAGSDARLLASVKDGSTSAYYYAGTDGCVSVPACAAGETTYTPTVGATAVRYVSPDGTDAAAGTRDDPLPLQTALSDAVPGTLVIALRGNYAGSQTMNSKPYLTPARAEVPMAVLLRSEEGAAVTVISGANGANADGSGAGAVRCVVLQDGARIEGFTLTGGRLTTTDADTSADKAASGVCANTYGSRTPVVRECVITDCRAPRCVTYYCTFLNCQIVGNEISSQYISYGSAFYGCLFARNKFGGTQAMAVADCENITWAADNTTPSGTTPTYTIVASGSLVNSVFFGKVDNIAATNCVFVGGVDRTMFYNCCHLSAADVAVDAATYRPTSGVSKLIDTGTNACLFAQRADDEAWRTDAGGLQRVMNGVIDIGAFECDWRETYAKDIRNVTVESASPSVVETDAKTVRIPAGGSLVLSPSVLGMALNFKVTGTGSLEIAGPDGIDRFGPSDETQKYVAKGGTLELRCVADAGACMVELLRSSSNRGLMLLFR